MKKILILGGVAGGATAAARLRRLDEQAEIILLERGDHVSYANCGLPYYVGGAIVDRNRLFVMTPELFRSTLNVDVRVANEVLAIDTNGKRLQIRNRKSQELYWESYDSLILSPGAEPIRPAIPGIDLEHVFTVRSVPDIDRIKDYVDARRPQRAVVVGGGFIGLEMAENLRERGMAVSIVEAQKQVMAGLDFDMASLVHHHITAKEVDLILNDAVASVTQNGNALEVHLQSGSLLPCDMVILSIGVKPETILARQAGIPVDERGYILVDDHMRTRIPDVYAVGDAVSVPNPLTGKVGPVPLAGPANKQARVAADHIVLGDSAATFKGAIGTAIAKVFDMTVACTGLAEKVCEREGIPHEAVIVHPSHHAGYYPGAKSLSLKVVFHSQNGKILGAQSVGFDGVDKRIDVLAAFLGMGGTVQDLETFEQAYAPPYSSAKDPVNHAGFIASNLMRGLSRQISWDQVPQLLSQGAFLLDVRTLEEYSLGHMEGAVNISNLELRSRLAEIPAQRTILVYCGVGLRGYLAERILRQNGFQNVVNLRGGLKTYEAASHVPSRSSTPDAISFQEGSGMPEELAQISKDVVLVDACGLQCPGPVMQLKSAIDKAMPGARLLVRATDAGFLKDAKAWCKLTGNLLVGIEEKAGIYEAVIEKPIPRLGEAGNSMPGQSLVVNGNEATLIVFSNDLDRALASFVIANGAAATGKKVTMFFTFWGLSVIRRREKVPVTKDFMGRMFDLMLPRSVHQLSLSKMNFGGAGAAMMKKRMESKSVEQLETMMEGAKAAGVRMVACLMSMDIMGVAREELIDGVEIGGVATYLEAASNANVNLFI